MNVPKRLLNLLNGVTDETSAAIGGAFTAIMPLLQRNEAPFFPDYTDHGVNHVESVLSTCDLIISDDAWNVFTREDAAVLILAVLTHDLGMLINIDGFCSLVETDINDVPKLSPTDEQWQKMWREFQLDARRFDGATLINIVGSPDTVSVNELNPANFTDRGMKIAGEFVRRHHHRLAHEIVMFGMPSEKGRISLFESVPKHLREMAGLIARSHGVPIRECIELLSERDRTSHREYRHIHPTYLMALVRLADYLDLDAERSPTSVLSVKSLKSPISHREWWAHKAIVDCHSHADDPECLHVVVEPSELPDVATFSVVEEKIKGIQEEIDACWAVIGEVYGRFPPLNRLSLRIRRIKSDIRQSSTISQLPFVPHKAILESARADLLRLLIEPLYGDHPGIGIRELVQNSLDAVRELEFILSGPTSINVEFEPLDGDVSVCFEKDASGNNWIVIADRGIGMTWTTVCKYYLTAGASFRQSEAWKKRFTDEEGTSQILRSGRFGIGVLAAFLIGDRVHVSTRHADQSEEKGVEFEFGLDDTIIEMRWLRRKVGTTVRVRTSEPVIKRLMDQPWRREEWDWYCLEKPTVIRKNVDGKTLRQQHKIPGVDSHLPLHWHNIDVLGLQAVHWTFNEKVPRFVCNGILIPSAHINLRPQFDNTSEYYERATHLMFKSPQISIYDPDGKLPLNLARNDLAGSYKHLDDEIANDLCRNFIAYALINGPNKRIMSSDQFIDYTRTYYPGFEDFHYWFVQFGYLFDTPNGFGITDPWNISHFASGKCLLIRVKGNHNRLNISPKIATEAMRTYSIITCNSTNGKLTEFDYWHKLLFVQEGLPAFKGLNLAGIRTSMPTEWHKRFTLKQPKYIVKSMNIETKQIDFTTFTAGECGESDLLINKLAVDLIQNKVPIESLTELYFAPANEVPEPGRIAQLWKDVIGGPIIPFDKGERQSIISKLGPEFKRHIEEWSRPDALTRRRKALL